MLHRAVLAFAVAVGAAASSSPAGAETAEERLACTADAQTLCGEEIPDGRDRVYQCLVRRVNELSPPCKRIISASIVPPPPPAGSASPARPRK